jgi:O-acetyl-ADP-ribose deacetylase (regulator of RNase III)
VADFQARINFADGRRVEIHGPADITQETTDAIVNAANSHLIGGGGVDGAIHRAGGPSILAECRAYVSHHGILPAGGAMITGGGQLPAKYVIHTVGPVYRGGGNGEEDALASCHRESLRLAAEHSLRSLAFPAISTGAYGYPLHQAARVAVRAVLEAMPSAGHVDCVRFVLFDAAALRAYSAAAKTIAESQREYTWEEASS